MSRRVLIVEDEQSIRDILAELFDAAGSVVDAAGTLDEAKAALAQQVYDLIVTDIRLGGKRDGGLQVMAASGLLSPDATVIVLTAYPDADNRHASLRLGATHFLEKPVDLQTIAALAAQAGVSSALIPVAAERPTGGVVMGMTRSAGADVAATPVRGPLGSNGRLDDHGSSGAREAPTLS